MKKQLLRFTLYAIIIYLTGSTLNPPIAASHPLGGHETHFFGVIDGQRNKRHSDQFPNRNYARTFTANLNVGEPYTVRLIYFLPSDRQPQPDIDAKMDALIKEVQQGYAFWMEYHGFGRKTFTLETDATGKAVVHHVQGKFNDVYYQRQSRSVWEEIREQFDMSKNVYLAALDISSEILDNTIAGYGWNHGAAGGWGLMPASGRFFNVGLAYHELAHAFGLNHDYRGVIGASRVGGSACACEWLDVHPYFNTNRQSQNLNNNTTIEMLTPSLVSPPNTIRLRFEVRDPDGLHQAQLFIPESHTRYGGNSGGLIACKRLNSTNTIVEFVTTTLVPGTRSVYLSVIDVHGNFSGSKHYPIDITALLPPPEAVSIPDANLAAIVREAVGLDQSDAISSHTMLELQGLNAHNRYITDLTGLEHAINLRSLHLEDSSVSDLSVFAGLTQLTWLNLLGNNAISDISPLGGLTQLTRLYLGDNFISDVSALGGLTQLIVLVLWNNAISDISALGGLTQLTKLYLGGNSISDISALAGLTQLTSLYLGSNSISDISVLAGLTNLEWLILWNNAISDISVLADLTQLTSLDLSGNAISDISALGGLTQLTKLNLSGNAISDISALADLTQLTSLYLGDNFISDVSPLLGLNLTGAEWDSTGLYLGGNPLSYASINTHIPAMQAKGIEVQF